MRGVDHQQNQTFSYLSAGIPAPVANIDSTTRGATKIGTNGGQITDCFTRADRPGLPVQPLLSRPQATDLGAVGGLPDGKAPLQCESRRTLLCRDRHASLARALPMKSQEERRHEDAQRSPASRPLCAEPPSVNMRNPHIMNLVLIPRRLHDTSDYWGDGRCWVQGRRTHTPTRRPAAGLCARRGERAVALR